jgi:hypothetical protein
MLKRRLPPLAHLECCPDLVSRLDRDHTVMEIFLYSPGTNRLDMQPGGSISKGPSTVPPVGTGAIRLCCGV